MNEIELLDQIENQLKDLSDSACQDIKNTEEEGDLEILRVSLLGKKGKLSNILKNMSKLQAKDRPKIGQKANILKTKLLEAISERKNQLLNYALEIKIETEKLDVTIPSTGTPKGNHHPLLSTQDEIIDIFCGLGYSVSNGPEIETDFYNFESLNIPKNHPARDMQDTFYLNDNLLLRTHTSPVQIRF